NDDATRVHRDQNTLRNLTKRQLGRPAEWKELPKCGVVGERLRDDQGHIVDSDRLKTRASTVRKREHKRSDAHETGEHVDELVFAAEYDRRTQHRPVEVARSYDVLCDALAPKESVWRLAVRAVLRHVHKSAHVRSGSSFDHRACCIGVDRVVRIAVMLDSYGGEVNNREGTVQGRREVRRIPNVANSNFHGEVGKALCRPGGISNERTDLPALACEDAASVTSHEA